ncbi:MAG: hypothetical protein JW703_01175 [Candidatus Diapherotrites archaeon]|nr:hypothetical protein [Candidatus Diapherotrites archaeon]
MVFMIAGLSKKEIEIISWLEFYEKYFFSINEINHFFRNKTQQYNSIKNLMKKKRIIKLNKTKYYLVPIKAKNGTWVERSFIIADEIFNGENYFIGGYAAANYWRATDQIPMQIDIYTTKRQGKKTVLNSRFVFHRTTEKNIKENSCIKKMENHSFRILKKKEAEKWMKLRE